MDTMELDLVWSRATEEAPVLPRAADGVRGKEGAEMERARRGRDADGLSTLVAARSAAAAALGSRLVAEAADVSSFGAERTLAPPGAMLGESVSRIACEPEAEKCT